jgi:hypothetical protein
MDMEIGLGTRVGIVRGDTAVFGAIDGMKLSRGEVERVSIESMDYWFWMSDGWQFISDEEESENGEI